MHLHHLKFSSCFLNVSFDLFFAHIIIRKHDLHQYREICSGHQCDVVLLCVLHQLLVYASSHQVGKHDDAVFFMLLKKFFKLLFHIVFRCYISINRRDLCQLTDDQLGRVTDSGGHFSMCGNQNLFHVILL